MNNFNAIQTHPTYSKPPVRWQPLPPGPPLAPGDRGLLPDLMAYWKILKNRRWTVLGVLGFVVLGVALGTVLTQKKYLAVGSLEINQESPDIVTVDSMARPQAVLADDYLQTQIGILQSVALATRVIHKLGLEKNPDFNSPPSPLSPTHWFGSKTPTEDELFQGTLQLFQTNLEIDPVPGSRLVQVSIQSTNPVLAAQIVNTVLDTYVELRSESNHRVDTWLSDQLIKSKADLQASEKQLQDYARKNGLMFLEADKGDSENIASERLRQIQQELTGAQSDRYEKEALYHQVQAGNYASLPGMNDNKAVPDISVLLAQARQQEAQLSTTFTPDYWKVKEIRNQIQQLEASLAKERQEAAERITRQYQAAVQREEMLRREYRQQSQVANQIGERSSNYNMLKDEVATNKQLYAGLQQKLKDAEVSAALKSTNVNVVDKALVPIKPKWPNPLLNMALALVTGLGLGVGVAFVREYLDTSFRSTEEVDRFLDVPALAMIPSVQSLQARSSFRLRDLNPRTRLALHGRNGTKSEAARWVRIDEDRNPHAHLAEAFGCLRTAVLLSPEGPPPRSLLISSSQPGEGKTTVSTNLAISLAQLSRRVLLIDADMRRPSIHRALKIENEAGLSNYLQGESDWRDLTQISGVPGLTVLTGGPSPATPAELLSTGEMRTLIQEAAAEFDFVLVDSPALLINAADARILSSMVDGVVLVVRSGSTPRETVARARAQAPNIMGVILNQLDIRSFPSYYSDYYAPQEKPGATPVDPQPAGEFKPLATETPVLETPRED